MLREWSAESEVKRWALDSWPCPGVMALQTFLAYVVILCFEKRFHIRMHCCSPKVKQFSYAKFCHPEYLGCLRLYWVELCWREMRISNTNCKIRMFKHCVAGARVSLPTKQPVALELSSQSKANSKRFPLCPAAVEVNCFIRWFSYMPQNAQYSRMWS